MNADGETFDRGFQVIEYPHIRRQHIYDAADATMKVIDVKTPPNLTIGYVMGVGDQVPPAIEQLGAKVEMISAGRSRVGQPVALRRHRHRRPTWMIEPFCKRTPRSLNMPGLTWTVTRPPSRMIASTASVSAPMWSQ